jgi:DnaJ domain
LTLILFLQLAIHYGQKYIDGTLSLNFQWPMPDPYKILGLEQTATLDDIRQAYRIKAAKYHPDQGGGAWVYQQVTDAYAALLKKHGGEETKPPPPPDANVPIPVIRTRANPPPSAKPASAAIEINAGGAKSSSASAIPKVRGSTHRPSRGKGLGVPLVGTMLGGICAIVASYFIVETLRPRYWRNTFFPESTEIAKQTDLSSSDTDTVRSNTPTQSKKIAGGEKAKQNNPKQSSKDRRLEKTPSSTANNEPAELSAETANRVNDTVKNKRPLSFDPPDEQPDATSPKSTEKKTKSLPEKKPRKPPRKIPSEADLKAAKDYFRATLEKDLERRQSHGERVEAAQSVLAQALQPGETDPARTYYLFASAAELAATTQVLELNLKIIDEFTQAFEADAIKLQEKAIAGICQVRDGNTPPLALSVEMARRAFREIFDNRVELAAELLRAAKKLAREDEIYANFLTQAIKDCDRYADEITKGRALEKELDGGKTPTAAELRSWGFYQGLVFNLWDDALEAFSECNDKSLAAAAKMEIDLQGLESHSLSEAQTISHLWHDVAKREKNVWHALALSELAGFWDELIVKKLSRDDQFAKQRLAELEIRRANLVDPIVLLPEILTGRAFHVFVGNDWVVEGAKIQNRALFRGKLRRGSELNAPLRVENNVAVVTFPSSPNVPFRFLSFYQVGHEVACDLLDADKKKLSSGRVRWSP